MATTQPPPRPAGSSAPEARGPLIPAPRVFFPSVVLLVAFVTVAAVWPGEVGGWIADANSAVVQDLGWWYIALVTGFVAFCLWAILSPVGTIVLGKDDDEPDFGLASWFAMLFAAGMGIGLVFYGVSEPLWHNFSPPPGVLVPESLTDSVAGEAQVARRAMDVTFLHWGLHAWAIYVVVGLAVAYSVHRKGNPISIRWALEPLLGRRVHGFLGDAIDVTAVLGTLFGVATSLGLGVSQIAGGLQHLDVIDSAGEGLLVLLIIAITSVALVSVVTGLDKGIKWLSNTNMVLAIALVCFVLVVGPTVFIMSDFVTQVGSYLQNFLSLSFDAMPFQGEPGREWLGGWTTFYWGWWMSWAPFVGIFIARISKGRTVREFVTGVLLVPTLVTFLWFSVLGGSALYGELFGEGPEVEAVVDDETGPDFTLALFLFFDTLPMSTLLSVVAIVLIVVFFVTSSDSGSFVVDMLASGGNPNPPVWSRAMWAALEGAVAAVLLLAGGGGLDALKTMAILLALPFSLVMVLMVLATAKALLAENRGRKRIQRRWLAEELARELDDRHET